MPRGRALQSLTRSSFNLAPPGQSHPLAQMQRDKTITTFCFSHSVLYSHLLPRILSHKYTIVPQGL